MHPALRAGVGQPLDDEAHVDCTYPAVVAARVPAAALAAAPLRLMVRSHNGEATLEASWWRGGAALGAEPAVTVDAAAKEVLLTPPASEASGAGGDGDGAGDGEAAEGEGGGGSALRLQLRFASKNIFSSSKAMWELSGVPREAWAAQ